MKDLNYKFCGKEPQVDNSCFIAKSADVIGDVIIEKDCSIWFGAVIRGDVNSIYIGEGSNVQDNSVLHVSEDKNPIEIGKNVTVGHGSILHGCKVGSNSLIGMGSTILDNAQIGEFTLIGAGSLVTENKIIPSGVLCMGRPAKVVRYLTEQEKQGLIESSKEYIKVSKEY
jgi:carbonic anhydrase/acetyltransferase-like protein (isoleucine patch superfamily)